MAHFTDSGHFQISYVHHHRRAEPTANQGNVNPTVVPLQYLPGGFLPGGPNDYDPRAHEGNQFQSAQNHSHFDQAFSFTTPLHEDQGNSEKAGAGRTVLADYNIDPRLLADVPAKHAVVSGSTHVTEVVAAHTHDHDENVNAAVPRDDGGTHTPKRRKGNDGRTIRTTEEPQAAEIYCRWKLPSGEDCLTPLEPTATAIKKHIRFSHSSGELKGKINCQWACTDLLPCKCNSEPIQVDGIGRHIGNGTHILSNEAEADDRETAGGAPPKQQCSMCDSKFVSLIGGRSDSLSRHERETCKMRQPGGIKVEPVKKKAKKSKETDKGRKRRQ